jgi:hypothetical protein
MVEALERHGTKTHLNLLLDRALGALPEHLRDRVTEYGHDPRIGIFDVVDGGGGHARIVATAALPEKPR